MLKVYFLIISTFNFYYQSDNLPKVSWLEDVRVEIRTQNQPRPSYPET